MATYLSIACKVLDFGEPFTQLFIDTIAHELACIILVARQLHHDCLRYFPLLCLADR